MEGSNGSTKYLIKASIETDGVVERPDVVGAIFGQTEGILENDLDLRELQKEEKIGRINVNVKSEKGRSRGAISIPSSLKKDKTAMIGAALETIDRVGPCEAEISVDKIQDTKEAKRQFIEKRAQELVQKIGGSEKEEEEKKEEKKKPGKGREVEKYKGLPAGPAAAESDAIIIVEGRSDVINLLENGIRNTVAIEGTSVPSVVSEISKKKTTTVFLDGDRGGDLILKEMLQVADIDYVARAPEEKTVEDLNGNEVREALKNKKQAKKVEAALKKEGEETVEEDVDDKLANIVSEIKATSKAQLFDEDMEMMNETEVRNLTDELEETDNVNAVIFDGVITQKIADLANEKGINYLVGMRKRIKEEPEGIEIKTIDDF